MQLRGEDYGPLHIPPVIWEDAVPHQQVSLGCPREWQQRPSTPAGLVQIPPSALTAGGRA